MLKINNLPTPKLSQEEIIHKKISVIEKIPTGVGPRANAILVLLGEKPAVEMYIPDKEHAEKAVKDLKDIGLFAEISKKPRVGFDPESADVLIARTQEILDELKQIHPNKHHRRYGELMGYPQTAIDAFLGENGAEILPAEEQDKMLGDIPTIFNGTFVFSKDHKDEELAVVKHRTKLIAQKAPELFYDSFGKEGADKLLSYILNYY
ncbi:MAG: hypothetical protein WCO84_03185 [bacterium]